MRIAVIGAGRMGAIRVEDLAADPRVDEVLVTNRTEATATSLASLHGAKVIPWAERPDINADGYVIASATDQHVTHLTDAFRFSAPILCEKPISLTPEDDQRVIDLAAAAGAPIQMAFQRRFDAGIRAMHDAISAGELGTLYGIHILAHDHTIPRQEFIGGSGGIFRDLHVHDFDLARWLTGAEVASVYATRAVRHVEFLADFDDADVTLIHVVTTNGVQISISGTRHDAVGHDVRLEAFGTKDSVTAGVNRRTPLHPLDGDLVMCDPPYVGFVDRFREAFRAETAAFVSFVAGDIPNPCPPQNARAALQVAMACEESVRTGQPVRVADIMGE